MKEDTKMSETQKRVKDQNKRQQCGSYWEKEKKENKQAHKIQYLGQFLKVML
uniref:Uncharacterized protein n=1 Tax=Rhizophora mucronata TaxID=61149 RepID=A0A2P2J3Y3_RHIMU